VSDEIIDHKLAQSHEEGPLGTDEVVVAHNTLGIARLLLVIWYLG